MKFKLWNHDRKIASASIGLVGVDEAGRGALAGPVVAGAVFLPGSFFQIRGRRKAVGGITDSKVLNPESREIYFSEIQGWIRAGEMLGATGSASVNEIEAYNILGATRLAMIRALESLQDAAEETWFLERTEKDVFFESSLPGSRDSGQSPGVFLDGLPMRPFPYAHEGLVQGDGKSLSIAMGSILAKVTRDRALVTLAQDYSDYGFSEHKGYGTPSHREALVRLGPCVVHRPTFLRKVLGAPLGDQERFDFDSVD